MEKPAGKLQRLSGHTFTPSLEDPPAGPSETSGCWGVWDLAAERIVLLRLASRAKAWETAQWCCPEALETARAATRSRENQSSQTCGHSNTFTAAWNQVQATRIAELPITVRVEAAGSLC